MNVDLSSKAAAGILILAVLITLAPQPRGGDTPQITRVVPDVQLSATGRLMTVEGEGFDRNSLVYLGGTILRGSRLDREGRLLAPIPEGLDTGTYQLRVVTPGSSDASPATAFTLMQSETAPVVREVSPVDMALSDELPLPMTITGSGFLPGLSVRIGNRRAVRVIEVTDERVDILVDALPENGIHDIVVTNPTEEEGRLHHAVTVGQV